MTWVNVMKSEAVAPITTLAPAWCIVRFAKEAANEGEIWIVSCVAPLPALKPRSYRNRNAI